jgi:hypothetical protein
MWTTTPDPEGTTMADKLYRCINEACADGGEDAVPVLDFVGNAGVCPKCKATHKDNPHTVVERARVHYLVNDDAGAIRTPNGRRAIACDPTRAKMTKHATGEATAVSCPECRASAVYAAHVAGNVDQGQRIVAFDGDAARMGGGAFAAGLASG